jgi:hypothetical protein
MVFATILRGRLNFHSPSHNLLSISDHTQQHGQGELPRKKFLLAKFAEHLFHALGWIREPCKTCSWVGVTLIGMSKELVSDELWEIGEPLLPEEPPKGGRPRVEDRAALTGIVFVLESGIPWEMLPKEMAADRDRPAGAALARLAGGGRVGGVAPRAAEPARRGWRDRLGAGSFGLGERAGQKGGQRTGANPTDKARAGSKRHVVADRGGIPLSVMRTAANVHDSMVFEQLLDSIGPIKPPRGSPRKRPEKLHADKKCARTLKKRGIKTRIARK